MPLGFHPDLGRLPGDAVGGSAAAGRPDESLHYGLGPKAVRVSLFTHDLIVVGAGPAGTAAAIAATRHGSKRVIIVDKAPPGRDKVCGDAIGPEGAAELVGLGLPGLLRAQERARSFRLTSPAGVSASGSPPVAGYVVARVEFDARLLQAAIAVGVEFEQLRVRSLHHQGAGTRVGEKLSAPVVIGADGANSVVRRALGQPANTGKHLAVAVRGYAPRPAGTDELFIRWDSQPGGGLCYVWAFPLANGVTNIGYGCPSTAAGGGRARLVRRLAELLPDFDVAGTELAGHRLPLSTWRPVPAVGNVLLTGDAASLINPTTGEGISYALASGALAGRAAATCADTAGAVYTAEMKAKFGGHHKRMARIYPLLDIPIAVEAAVRACARDRVVFERILELGLGAGTLRGRDLLRFAAAAVLPQRASAPH